MRSSRVLPTGSNGPDGMAAAEGDPFVANSDLNAEPGTSVTEHSVYGVYHSGEPWPSSGLRAQHADSLVHG